MSNLREARGMMDFERAAKCPARISYTSRAGWPGSSRLATAYYMLDLHTGEARLYRIIKSAAESMMQPPTAPTSFRNLVMICSAPRMAAG